MEIAYTFANLLEYFLAVLFPYFAHFPTKVAQTGSKMFHHDDCHSIEIESVHDTDYIFM